MTTSGPVVLHDTVEYFHPFDGVTADDVLAWIRTRRHATDRSRLPDAQATAMEAAWETVMAAVGPADWRSWLVDDLDTDALAHASAATDHAAATTAATSGSGSSSTSTGPRATPCASTSRRCDVLAEPLGFPTRRRDVISWREAVTSRGAPSDIQWREPRDITWRASDAMPTVDKQP